jgi:ABC-type sulfate transport system substrate-binding protein
MRVRGRSGAALLAAVALLAAGCGGDKLTLVAYSTPREAYERLIPAFQKADAGNGVGFSQSYGASGDQSRAVQNGLAGDVVALSLEPDMARLVDAGLVAKDWNAGEYQGMVTDSVVVHLGFEVRVDLVLQDGQRLLAQVSREDAEQLELRQGQVVVARPSRVRVFST